MTNKFTVKAQKALEKAQAEACALGHTYIGSEHILLGLAAERESVASRLLSARGIDFNGLRSAIAEISGSGSRSQAIFYRGIFCIQKSSFFPDSCMGMYIKQGKHILSLYVYVYNFSSPQV